MKIARTIVIFLLLMVGVNALIAGYLFMIDPSGSRLHIPVYGYSIPLLLIFIFPEYSYLLLMVFLISLRVPFCGLKSILN